MQTQLEMKVALNSPYIDNSILNEIKEFMGEEGEDTVNELISIFLKNTPKAISQISDDLKSGDNDALKAHIHGLKGSSAAVGAIGVSSICRNMEEVLRLERPEEIYDLFEKLIKVYKQVELEFCEKL
jgi:HPt (histidine-containing phosphotransfer) domain-containing protein